MFNPEGLELPISARIFFLVSVLAEELKSLNEVWREEQSPHGRVTSIELKREQVDTLGLVAWFIRQEHLHLILVMWGTLELPGGDHEGLEAAQVSQDQ